MKNQLTDQNEISHEFELIKKYKYKITPKEYTPNLLTDYLKNKYRLKDITNEFKITRHYEFILENIKHSLVSTPSPEIVVFQITEDEKSKNLYTEDYKECFREDVMVIIEKNKGYIESTSNDLFIELMLEKSVSQEDYDNNTIKLIELLSLFDEIDTY